MSTEIEPKRDSMDASIQDIDSKLAATTLQPSPSTKRPLGLTDLPPSVRNKIYAHVLDTELVNLGRENVSYTHSIKDGLLHFSASRPPFFVATAVFLVNKQISSEARIWFYSKNLFIMLKIYTQDARHAKTLLQDSGLLFATPSPSQLSLCKMHAMEITLVEKSSSHLRAAIIFPAQYLPRLITFMAQASRASTSWAPSHALFLSVVNSYELDVARLQGDLLEPFRQLTNLGAVTVTSSSTNLLEGFAAGLQSSMTAAQFDPEAWLACIGGMVDRGVAALRSGEWKEAAGQCRAAIIAMTYAYLTRAEALHMRPDAFHRGVQRKRYGAEITLGAALRRAHADTTSSPSLPQTSSMDVDADVETQSMARELLDAEAATSHALSLAMDSPSPKENPWFKSLPAELIPPNKAEWFDDVLRARAWCEVGLCHLSLGECLFAAGDLERAGRLVEGIEEGIINKEGRKMIGNGDEDIAGLRKEIETAFGRARQGIDWSVRPGAGLKRAMRLAKKSAE
jgi:hypothetical protein